MPFGFVDLPGVSEPSPIRDGAIGERELSDGRVVALYPMLFTWRVCVGAADNPFGYDDAWCYPQESLALALDALAHWDGTGDPVDGWVKHVGSGRRRPDGTPESEYVAL